MLIHPGIQPFTAPFYTEWCALMLPVIALGLTMTWRENRWARIMGFTQMWLGLASLVVNLFWLFRAL